MNGSNKFHMEKMDLEKREESRDKFFCLGYQLGLWVLSDKQCRSKVRTWKFVAKLL